MPTEKEEKAVAVVESLIDETSLKTVLDAVAKVCTEKAEHVSVNWQDPRLAGWWGRRAQLVATVAQKVGMENT